MSDAVSADNDKCEAAEVDSLYLNKSCNGVFCVVDKRILDAYIHLEIATCVQGCWMK